MVDACVYRRRLNKKTKDPEFRSMLPQPFISIRRQGVADELLRQARLAIDRFHMSEVDLENLQQEYATVKWQISLNEASGLLHVALDKRVEECV